MLPMDNLSLVELFDYLYFHFYREVQTLTREDRDINGWLHFLFNVV